jgi:hypothetical protein
VSTPLAATKVIETRPAHDGRRSGRDAAFEVDGAVPHERNAVPRRRRRHFTEAPPRSGPAVSRLQGNSRAGIMKFGLSRQVAIATLQSIPNLSRQDCTHDYVDPRPPDPPATAPDRTRVRAVAAHPASFAKIDAGAKAVADIAAKGEPAYGINTGFGRLASTHIPHDQLELLQENLVLSHAVGVGEPMARSSVRLLMALKLSSLAAVIRASAAK